MIRATEFGTVTVPDPCPHLSGSIFPESSLGMLYALVTLQNPLPNNPRHKILRDVFTHKLSLM